MTIFYFRDQSIPTLETVLANDEKLCNEIETLSQLISRQSTVESTLAQAQAATTLQECTPPPACHDFQTARLFLSHFGLLSLDEVNIINKLFFTLTNDFFFRKVLIRRLTHHFSHLTVVIMNFARTSYF